MNQIYLCHLYNLLNCLLNKYCDSNFLLRLKEIWVEMILAKYIFGQKMN